MSLRAAKAEAKASAGRIAAAWSALIGSRVLVAIAAMFAIAFAMTLAFSPSRLPPIGFLTPASVGLPVGVDLAKERAAAEEILDAAKRQGGVEKASAFIDRYPQAVPILNWAGLAISLGLTIAGLWAQTRLYRRGINPV
ncbi:MAG: hypothetical protein HXY28_03160 [Hydrogenophilaceae bacterium]|jgi:hypothetical protein|nr:hypothetical protein [Hydrogenophilaceae bacterium]